MALPTSGPLSLANIQAEFGGSNPISLSEYYAGGGLVPSGTSGTNGPVPSSGTISISNFYGTSNVTVQLSNQNISSVGAGTRTAGYRLNLSGDVEQLVQATYTDIGDWITPKSAAGANYEARATLVSGSIASGTLNTWLALSASRQWFCQQASIGTQSATLTIEIRNASTLSVLASASIFLEAERTV